MSSIIKVDTIQNVSGNNLITTDSNTTSIKNPSGTTGLSIDSGGIVSHTKIPMLKVGRGSTYNVNGTGSIIPFDSFSSSHVFDPEDNMSAFNTTTHTYTIPAGLGGLYHISAHVYTTTSNANQIAIYQNGNRKDAIGTDGGTSGMNQGAIVKRFAAGDEIQLWLFCSNNLVIQPNVFHTYWQMNFLG